MLFVFARFLLGLVLIMDYADLFVDRDLFELFDQWLIYRADYFVLLHKVLFYELLKLKMPKQVTIMQKQSQKIHSDPTDTELAQYPFPPLLINSRFLI